MKNLLSSFIFHAFKPAPPWIDAFYNNVVSSDEVNLCATRPKPNSPTRNTERRADLGLGLAAGVQFSDALIAFSVVGRLFLVWRRGVETCYNRGNYVRNGVFKDVPYLVFETLWARNTVHFLELLDSLTRQFR
jgi:hypothetical protein